MGNRLKPLEFKDISNFICGYKPMDEYIQCSLQRSTLYNFCKPYGLYSDSNELIAIVAICFGSISLGEDYVDDLMSGCANCEMYNINYDYREIFISKTKYPSLEIAYLAVDERFHGMGYGEEILDSLEYLAKTQKIAGVQFLSLDAICTKDYNIVGFYSKCGFTVCSENTIHDTVRMYRPIMIDIE